MALNYGNQSKSYLEQLLRIGLNSYKSCGYQQITVGATISTLTIPADTKFANIEIESTATGNPARILQSTNTTVTSSIGMPLAAGVMFAITDYANLAGFQIIKDQAGTTLLNVEYFK